MTDMTTDTFTITLRRPLDAGGKRIEGSPSAARWCGT